MPPTPAEALAVVDEHYRAVAQFWTPDRTSCTGLGRLHVDHQEFKARYDAPPGSPSTWPPPLRRTPGD